MNKKVIVALSLVAAIAAIMTLSQSSISTNMIQKHNVMQHNGNNKWGGFAEDSPCAKDCTGTDSWCGPQWNSRYYCCDSAADCQDKKKCIWGHCKEWKNCENKKADFACTD